MQVQDAIRKQPVTIEADETISTAARMMDEHAVGALLVTDGGDLTGIVTDRDLVVRGLARHVDPSARVDSMMSTNLLTLDASSDLKDALHILRSHAIRRLPVLDGGAVVGIVTVDDLLIDIASELVQLARPVTGQVIFGSPEPRSPATVD